jgi:uncharacterized protein (TIGR02453 family)
MSFNPNTFKYFRLAKKNTDKKEWFEKNKTMYEENVKQPFQELILKIQKDLKSDLVGIPTNPNSISRPLRPSNRADKGLVKDFASVMFSEKRTSMFEWNPGIYIQVGNEEDRFLGLGIYMPSSRQTTLWREAVLNDPYTLEEILEDKKFIKSWKELAGDKLVKGPKGLLVPEEFKYLVMYKQFHTAKYLSEKEMCSKNFFEKTTQHLKNGMPYLNWLRKTMGTYSRSPSMR